MCVFNEPCVGKTSLHSGQGMLCGVDLCFSASSLESNSSSHTLGSYFL